MKYILFVLVLLISVSASAQERLISSQETTFRFRWKNAPRAHNVRLAASKIRNITIEPGQEFSFNEIVGPRTRRLGFKKAPTILRGQLVDDWGGGTCQVAGTLHAAVLRAGLEILEAHAHSRVSSYIGPGLDATVVYGARDFRFRNNFDFPITIRMHEPQRGILSAEVWGPRFVDSVVYVKVLEERRLNTIRRHTCRDLVRGRTRVVDPGSRYIVIRRIRKIGDRIEVAVFRYQGFPRIIDVCPR